MPRKKTSDPRRVALLDKQAKLRADYERHYSRMKRAFTRLEKCRQALIRVAKRIDALDAESNGVEVDAASNPNGGGRPGRSKA